MSSRSVTGATACDVLFVALVLVVTSSTGFLVVASVVVLVVASVGVLVEASVVLIVVAFVVVLVVEAIVVVMVSPTERDNFFISFPMFVKMK